MFSISSGSISHLWYPYWNLSPSPHYSSQMKKKWYFYPPPQATVSSPSTFIKLHLQMGFKIQIWSCWFYPLTSIQHLCYFTYPWLTSFKNLLVPLSQNFSSIMNFRHELECRWAKNCAASCVSDNFQVTRISSPWHLPSSKLLDSPFWNWNFWKNWVSGKNC